MRDQEDLASLCAHRRMRTPEAYAPNDDYGLASVLKAYAGYPAERSLPVLVPHGVYFDEHTVHRSEAAAPLPAVFSYPEYRDRAYRRSSHKKVIPGASPFLYALALLGPLDPPERRGTLFFPGHSTATVPTVIDWDGLADELDGLPDPFRPVSVCVHWHDVQQGRAEAFRGRGYQVVSAGHIADPEFLFRLIHLMSIHAYAASNEVGSSLVYAAAAGMPCFLFGSVPERPTRQDRPGSSAERRKREVASLFSAPATALTEEQRAVARFYLRADAFRTSEDLAGDLYRASRLR